MFFFLSLLLQCKFANSTLLSLLSFSYLITPYDAQASSAFSALMIIVGQGPTALAVGADRGCLDIFSLVFPFSLLSGRRPHID